MLPPIMAVNGPPNGEVDLDLPLSSDPSCSPHLGKPPTPDSYDPTTTTTSTTTTVPVSPGKKRVRISDSTSVRVIEDPPRPARPAATAAPSHKTYYQQFNSDFLARRQQAEDSSPRPPRPFAYSSLDSEDPGRKGEDGDFGEDVQECRLKEYLREYHEGAEECAESLSKTDAEDVSSAVVPSFHRHSPANTETPLLSLAPFRETNNRIYLVSDPPGFKPANLGAAKNGTLYVIDSVTGWPLKRSPSLESRDNPFLPGGDLSREAEDLLSKATIVRDKFFLHQHNRQDASSPSHPCRQDLADGALPNDSKRHPPAEVQDRITPATASATAAAAPAATAKLEATPDPHPRENGKTSDGVASPDGVRVVEVGEDGGKGAGGSDTEGEQAQDKDKAKRRNKCCVLM